MRTLLVSEKGIFLESRGNVLDLIHNYVGVSTHRDFLCRLNSKEKVQVVMAVESVGYVKWQPKKKLSPDAFYALQIYKIKCLLTNIANSYDAQHAAERDLIYKVLGILQPIFLEGL